MSVAQTGTVVGVILAGGLGRRLGGGKAQRLLAGRPLLGHVIARLEPQFAPGQLLLNSNGEAVDLAHIGLPTIADSVAGRPGPLAGILAAMIAAKDLPGRPNWVLSAPVDTPFLPLDLVAVLGQRQRETGTAIVLARSDAGLCQVCGLWSVSLAATLAQSLESGQNKVLDFAAQHGAAEGRFPLQRIGSASADPFFNINTPDELAHAERILSA